MMLDEKATGPFYGCSVGIWNRCILQQGHKELELRWTTSKSHRRLSHSPLSGWTFSVADKTRGD